MKKILTLALLTAILISMSACNTVNGFGKDVKKAGETIEKAGKS
jgi:predicted small secreted protein